MPLFEYECKRCQHQFEALVRGRERPKCPECGSRSLAKLLSTFSAGVSRTLPRSCAGSMPHCQPGCDPSQCAFSN